MSVYLWRHIEKSNDEGGTFLFLLYREGPTGSKKTEEFRGKENRYGVGNEVPGATFFRKSKAPIQQPIHLYRDQRKGGTGKLNPSRQRSAKEKVLNKRKKKTTRKEKIERDGSQ